MLYAIITVIAIIADQLVKYWVTANIPLNTGVIEVIPNIFHLINIHNSGAAFSLLEGWRWPFVALAVVFTILVIIAVSKDWIKGSFGKWMAILVMAGAIGNCIDRVMYGYVVDMFNIPCIGIIQIFNIADLYITFCGILFCIDLLIPHKNKSEKTEEKLEEDIEEEPKKAKKAKKKRKSKQEDESEEDVTVYSKPVKTESEDDDVKKYTSSIKAEPATIQPEPKVAPAQMPKDDMDFTLDDILNEFK